MRARSVVDANIHAPRYRGAGATASRQMRVELGAAARPANPDPQVRVEPSAPSAERDAFVAVNPGRVAKGNAGGAFALVRIAEHAPVGPGDHAHAVGERARVDIVRV